LGRRGDSFAPVDERAPHAGDGQLAPLDQILDDKDRLEIGPGITPVSARAPRRPQKADAYLPILKV